MNTDDALNDEDLNLLDSLFAPFNADIQHKYKISINYLCYLKEPELVLTDSKSHRVIGYLKDQSEDNDELIKFILEKKNVIGIFINSLAYYLEELKTYLSSYSKTCKVKLSEEHEQKCLEKFDFVQEMIILIRNLTNKSKSLCYKFHDNHLSQTLCDYFNDDDLVRRLFKFKQRSSMNIKQIGLEFLLGLLGVLLNISYIADYRRKDFEDLKATEKLLKFVEYVKTYDNARLLVYVILTNIVNEHDIETAFDTKQAIEDLVRLISIGADKIKSKDNLKRIRVDVDFDEEIEIFEEICLINDDWNILDLLLALYRLAINDNLKLVIYQNYNIKDELEKILLFGNDTEKEYVAKLMWQLCFDKTVAKELQEAETLINCIRSISDRNITSKRKNLKKYCLGIIWSVSKFVQNADVNQLSRDAAAMMFRSLLPNLNLKEAADQNNTQPQQQPLLLTSSTANKGKHIMISYNAQSRDDCLKIKASLEKLGHIIWIDVEDICGSSLEAMANAIENSKCVLMCMTEKYKQSPNCRAEAEYAFKLGVPIIPLIMQENYMPDGWLGIILGSKIFVHFKKYPFEECMRRLLVELKPIIPPNTIHSTETIQPTNSKPDEKPAQVQQSKIDLKTWTNDEVRNWCAKFEFHQDIKNMLENFNGEHLIQLNEIKKQSADYFYKQISNKYSIDLFSIVFFINEFQKLFK